MPVPGERRAAGWPAGFDPDNLSRHASLNKTVAAARPGPLGRYAGRTGADLLGRDSILRLVAERVDGAVTPEGVSDSLDRGLASEDPATRRAAAAVVDEVGDRLAALLAACRDEPAARPPPPERAPYLAAWRTVGSVTLGGGLARGAVGSGVAARAATALAAAGARPALAVHASPVAPWLPLLGAARTGPAPAGDADVVVVDGGHTAIKRGVAAIRGGELAKLVLLPPVPCPTEAGALARGLAEAVMGAREMAGLARGGAVTMSVAAYVRDGRPAGDGATAYEALAAVAPEVEGAIGGRLVCVHDGTAAWRGAATTQPSAVVVMGTWLGVGFGPGRIPPIPLAEGFVVAPW